jgi:hypothetical protein
MAQRQQKSPPLKLIAPTPISTEPPVSLGEPGRTQWDRLAAEYDVSDVGMREVLGQICLATDRGAALRGAGRPGWRVAGRQGAPTPEAGASKSGLYHAGAAQPVAEGAAEAGRPTGAWDWVDRTTNMKLTPK